MVFDLNDFDETLQGPWEWDLKRLSASFTIAGRDNELDREELRKATRRVVKSYRKAMNDFADWRGIDIWSAMLKAEEIEAWANTRRGAKRIARSGAKAKAKHHRQALERLAEEVDGVYRLKSEAPLVVPLREIGQKLDQVTEQVIKESYRAYLQSGAPDLRVLLVDIGLWTLPTRWSAWVASVRGAGSCSCRGGIGTIRYSCR